ncbi:RimJ/RimL family protein N-acetyltransferase [Crossiella equi]|uniref:RimJ/RimL family protein N-acetyltransferase n=1 Tax=Crossiella equi TaxID=130796 RepID=A0ABS5ANS7_9PSEU|nr:GNAT family N-acetyltransferase [Crossiella equi]MBP2478216.1 RimJ/RimL family protein N-acetyltransferase [Crossiella equi]
MTPPEELATERLLLRRVTPADVDVVQVVASGALEHLRPWMPWAGESYPREKAAEFVAFAHTNWQSGQAYTYLLLREGRLIGIAGLERRLGPDALEIGYWLHQDETGAGYATEAAKALAEAAFSLDWVKYVQIWHDIANEPSGAVPRRLGFREVERREPPRGPLSPGNKGVDVVWQLDRPES